MAAEATDLVRLSDINTGWPLEEMWVTGELLDSGGELDAGSVILLLDVPPDALPWMARHPAGEWVGDRLRLGKRPMQWCYRPSVWPAWSARHRRVLRFWSAPDGVDETAIEGLRSGAGATVEAPADDQVREQLLEERPLAFEHLRRIVDGYWDAESRRGSRGDDAQDDLWRVAAGLIEIDDALASLVV